MRMKFEFDKLPINTLIGASWRAFKQITEGREIGAKYRAKYRLTKLICRLISSFDSIEDRRYNKMLKDKPLEADPVFVLGHWRSGTTFVHNVLSCDKQYGYTTTYHTVFPNIVLFGQGFFKSIMAKVMPSKRPLDSLELTPDQPQEEEFALSGMTKCNYYNFWFFPKDMLEYCDKYLTMQTLSDEERAEFSENFMRLVKISMHNTGGKRYLSKNPPHTGRVKDLLKIFPNAKFIYLIRNPYTVFESTRGFFSQTIVPLKLHDISEEALQANFVEVYKRLYETYKRDRELIPAGNLIEIKFEDFEADPIEATRKIYETLSLDGFEEALPQMEQYVGGKRGYKKNRYNYEEETVRVVESHWGESLKDWGYSLNTEKQ